MSTITTGFITTQNGTTEPTDIGSIFSTGSSSSPIYSVGQLQYTLSSSSTAIPFAYNLQNTTNVTVSQDTINISITVPQLGLYLVTSSCVSQFDPVQSNANIPYVFQAIVGSASYFIVYCLENQISGSVIIPVYQDADKTIQFTCSLPGTTSQSDIVTTIQFQMSYLSSLQT